MNVENQEPAEDRSQNEPRFKVDTSVVYQPAQPMNSVPEISYSDRWWISCDGSIGERIQCIKSRPWKLLVGLFDVSLS